MDTSTVPIPVSEQDNSKYSFVTIDYNENVRNYMNYSIDNIMKYNMI